MKKELPFDQLFERLLKSLVFAWPGENSATVKEKISAISRQQAQQEIQTLNQNVTASPLDVIKRITARAESWQFASLLNHIQL